MEYGLPYKTTYITVSGSSWLYSKTCVKRLLKNRQNKVRNNDKW